MRKKNILNPEIKIHYIIPESSNCSFDDPFGDDMLAKSNQCKGEFFINEKKKTVACRLRFQVMFPYRGDTYFPLVMDNYIDTVTAKAKCNDEDEFDVEVGKKIAITKAENKAYASVLRRIEKGLEDVKDFEKAYEAFKKKAEGHEIGNKRFLESLGGITYDTMDE